MAARTINKNTTTTSLSPTPSTATTTTTQSPQTSDIEMSASAAAAVAAVALDMKPKVEFLQKQQQIKKLVRRNASDKLKLIQMVHDNPILWDSRLPNFKGAEEEKNRAWEQIGREFNAPGRRVARAFKSLRESYRRELAHVKLMGSGFKPKWSLYDAMDFLRDVIRERKGGSSSHTVDHTAIGLNLSAFSQHLNNNNNKANQKLSALHSSFNESALNLSKCASLNVSQEDFYYMVKPELDLSSHSNGASTGVLAHPLPAHQHHQQQQQQLPQPSTQHDSRVTSTRNDTTQNTTYDDLDASSMRSGDETSVRNVALSHQGSDEVEELDAIDADFPYPLILDGNSPTNGAGTKRRRKEMGGDDGDDVNDDDDDDYDGQMLQQHRHLRQQNGGSMDMSPQQTVREVLNSKFCGFISAKLNSMEDSEADNLMNKILMLLVQTQGNQQQ